MTTRFLITVLSSFLFSCTGTDKPGNQPFFEGCISYEVHFTRKTDEFDSLTLQHIMGTSSEYCYKEGNTLIATPSTSSEWNLYRVAENETYYIQEGSDTIYWQSCDGPGAKIKSWEITPQKERVLGILCDELKVVFENKIIYTYYNSDTLRIDPAFGKYNTMMNEDFYTAKRKAISLKFIFDRPESIITYTATSIKAKRLNDTLFALPSSMPLLEEN